MAYWDRIFETTIHEFHIRRRQIYRDIIMKNMANWENMILHSFQEDTITYTQMGYFENMTNWRTEKQFHTWIHTYIHIYMNIWYMGRGYWIIQENWSEIEEENTISPLFIKNSGSLVWKKVLLMCCWILMEQEAIGEWST